MLNIKPLLQAKVLFVVSILCTIVIVWASLARKVPQIDVQQGDKIGHALAYCTLTTLWGLYAINLQSKYSTSFKKRMGRVALLCIAFGVLMEGLQYALTTYRVFDLQDALANAIGVCIGVLVVIGMKRFLDL